MRWPVKGWTDAGKGSLVAVLRRKSGMLRVPRGSQRITSGKSCVKPQRIQGCGVKLTCCPTFETEPDSGLPINQFLTDSMENRSSSVLRDPMGLELAAIFIVTAGLLVQERGIILANADCCFVSEAGERAMGFGMLISICAMPWVLIGMIISRFV
jgi:hypothetical protein